MNEMQIIEEQYLKNDVNYKEKFILQGEIFFSRLPYMISTVLGSCVSVVLYNHKYKLGGMNHILLNYINHQTKGQNYKYASFSTLSLINKMLEIDSNLRNTEAKIFGGSSLTCGYDIGKNNVKVAEQIIRDHKINIGAKFVEKEFGMKIYYYNFNNKVIVVPLKKTLNS